MDRRTSIRLMALAALPMAAGCRWNTEDVEKARAKADSVLAGESEPAGFFGQRDLQIVRTLADIILPADDRSPSASELGVPEFIDFMVADRLSLQGPIREGMAWIEEEAERLHTLPFDGLLPQQQIAMVERIAYPETAQVEDERGVAFFNLFRNLTASGFWTTKKGMADLGYMGNRVVDHWDGPPQSEMVRLGLSFDEWDVV